MPLTKNNGWDRYGMFLSYGHLQIWQTMIYNDDGKFKKASTESGGGGTSLDDLFHDKVNPTETELELFKIEFGVDYPPESLLQSFFRRNSIAELYFN